MRIAAPPDGENVALGTYIPYAVVHFHN